MTKNTYLWINWLELASDAIATRLNVDGSIDTSFGVDGTTLVDKFLQDRETSIDDLGREEANDPLLVKKGIYMLLEQNILARQVSIRIPNLT